MPKKGITYNDDGKIAENMTIEEYKKAAGDLHHNIEDRELPELLKPIDPLIGLIIIFVVVSTISCVSLLGLFLIERLW